MRDNDNIYHGDVARMNADHRRFGALDGDWAARCAGCGGRFSGGSSVYCPACLGEKTKEVCRQLNGARDWA